MRWNRRPGAVMAHSVLVVRSVGLGTNTCGVRRATVRRRGARGRGRKIAGRGGEGGGVGERAFWRASSFSRDPVLLWWRRWLNF